MKLPARIALALLALAVVATGVQWVRLTRLPGAARRSMAFKRFPEARETLERYLGWFASDDQARLALAEAWVLDDELPGEESCAQALEQLRQIPDSSPLAAQARTREGQMRFLVLQQPLRAERALRRAIELDPRSPEPHALLWRVLAMTGRTQLMAPVFWTLFELTPEEGRPERLRDWHLSEFSPGSSTAPVDRAMGFLAEGEKPSVVVDFKRFQQFRAAEPEEVVCAAAVSRLMLGQGHRDTAWEVLEKSESLPAAFQEPFFVASLVAVSVDLGWFDKAEAYFARWPEPREGFEYWKWQAIIQDEIHRDNAQAIAAYNRALAIWPGNEDWQLMFRQAHCYTRMGDKESAERIRSRAQRIVALMEPDVQVRVRKALVNLDDPEGLQPVADFYRDLGRERETALWEAHIARLREDLAEE